MSDQDKCGIKRCRNPTEIIHQGFPLCFNCWEKYCDGIERIVKEVKKKQETEEKKK